MAETTARERWKAWEEGQGSGREKGEGRGGKLPIGSWAKKEAARSKGGSPRERIGAKRRGDTAIKKAEEMIKVSSPDDPVIVLHFKDAAEAYKAAGETEKADEANQEYESRKAHAMKNVPDMMKNWEARWEARKAGREVKSLRSRLHYGSKKELIGKR